MLTYQNMKTIFIVDFASIYIIVIASSVYQSKANKDCSHNGNYWYSYNHEVTEV